FAVLASSTDIVHDTSDTTDTKREWHNRCRASVRQGSRLYNLFCRFNRLYRLVFTWASTAVFEVKQTVVFVNWAAVFSCWVGKTYNVDLPVTVRQFYRHGVTANAECSCIKFVKLLSLVRRTIGTVRSLPRSNGN